MKPIFLFISLFLIFSCSTQKNTQAFQKVNPVDKSIGVAYIYFSGEGISLGPSFTEFGPNLYVNGKKIGLLALGTYVPLNLKAGTYTIKTTSTWDNKVFADLSAPFSVENGESKYIEFALTAERVDHNTSKWISSYIERKESAAYPKIRTCKLNVALTEASKMLENPQQIALVRALEAWQVAIGELLNEAYRMRNLLEHLRVQFSETL